MALLQLLSVVGSSQRLALVQVMTRHGHRSPLVRSESWKEAGGHLSGHGTKVQFDRGQHLRQRYINSSSITRIQRDLNASTNTISFVSARSTGVDRTLLSAEALLLGLMRQSAGPVDEWSGEDALPNALHPVPIHSTSTWQDLEMRAFDKCPAMHDRVASALADNQLLRALQPGVDALVRAQGGKPTTLVKFRNDFDELEAALGEQRWETLPDEWELIVAANDRLEALKYSSSNAGPLAIGRLADALLLELEAAVDSDAEAPIILRSMHYPSLMSLALAMALDEVDLYFKTVPSFSAIFAIELYRDPVGVRFVVFDPDKDMNWQPFIPPSCAKLAGHDDERRHPDGLFSLHNMHALLSSVSFASDEAWCSACHNTEAPVCALKLAQDELDRLRQSAISPLRILGWISILFLVMILLVWMVYLLVPAKMLRGRAARDPVPMRQRCGCCAPFAQSWCTRLKFRPQSYVMNDITSSEASTSEQQVQ